ncbi:uncharacterized protein ATNIH1004_005335 [Aspergillus tanneri]|uniref:Uncharacterized protein n=1 Tax=Aspergillus tanneri TaxID=1220188 RepID=A0A5M9MMX8_9EURO|nr:uncharacterized protein ATNIH1004_005335 [Aspergillus tanneri]KAA8646660.1 hypothetical protein ATNIH1004_005335 [Aspergillus tanneri]
MAALAKNKWYQWYLKEVSSGRLTLPTYEQENNVIKIYYGERFCRVPDCAKAQKEYSATNNLRTHILSHETYTCPENSGGRVGTKVVDEATKWYKNLFAGIEPRHSTPANSSIAASSPHRSMGFTPKPKLPLKKDGTVHVTNMRAKVLEMNLQCLEKMA